VVGDLADVYEQTRIHVSDLVGGLSDEEAEKPVPATPEWRVRDIVAHLSGDLASLIANDFPMDFFASIGAPESVAKLNAWTDEHVRSRAERSVSEILDEWEAASKTIVDMMRGHTPWPDGVPWFADRVLVTDLGVHQHDIYGALGIMRDRDAAPVRIGVAGYVVVMDMRLKAAGAPALAIEADEKSWTIGGDEPATTLHASRFELFRALSGRRNAEQIRAYDWDGDPEPFVGFFYLYGQRSEALVE
jgi:uncharacterized protein (TIGR03083 family)